MASGTPSRGDTALELVRNYQIDGCDAPAQEPDPNPGLCSNLKQVLGAKLTTHHAPYQKNCGIEFEKLKQDENQRKLVLEKKDELLLSL